MYWSALPCRIVPVLRITFQRRFVYFNSLFFFFNNEVTYSPETKTRSMLIKPVDKNLGS